MATDTTSEPPAATAPTGPAARPVEPTYEDLARELIELEKQFPLPEQDDIFADARWFDAHSNTPALEPYRGTHVAVLNGAVVGHGWDSLQLLLDVARKFNVHPQRFILEYVPLREF